MSWLPVGVVIPLLRALVTPPSSVVVLTRPLATHVTQTPLAKILVSYVETFVCFSESGGRNEVTSVILELEGKWGK